jgi:hypothetical protein
LRANGAGSDIRLRSAVAQEPGRDLDAIAGGDIILGGLATARDVALTAGGLVSTQEIRAADDIAIRATGTVTTGALTSGFAPAVDVEGAADTLVTDNMLDGQDIDISGSSIAIGAARANGTGSDIRLRSPVAQAAGTDLDLIAGGDIVLGGLATARDVALQAGGLVNTQEIRAADDIAIRATAAVTTGALTSGFAPGGRCGRCGGHAGHRQHAGRPGHRHLRQQHRDRRGAGERNGLRHPAA